VQLKAVAQVNNTGSSGANTACVGVAGPSEDVGELTDNADALIDDAHIGSISLGNEEAVEALVAIDSDVYCDYYNIFGVLVFLPSLQLF
jgi:hypothetical protein